MTDAQQPPQVPASAIPSPRVPDRDRRLGPWAAATLVGLAIIVVVAGLGSWGLNQLGAWGTLPPPVININTAIRQIQPSLKLQVGTVTIDAHVEATEASSVWGIIPTGTTVTRYRAKDNRAQYLIDLSKLDDGNFRLGDATLTATIPWPTLDAELVEAQTDPAQLEYEAGGSWARWIWPKDLRDKCRTMIRAAVVKQGSSPEARQRAASLAEPALQDFLLKVAKHAGTKIHDVRIRWLKD
jgi:hypothetical protein